jgi:hypothetical protein
VIAIKKRNIRAQKKANQELLRQASARGGEVESYLERNTVLDEELARLDKEGLAG